MNKTGYYLYFLLMLIVSCHSSNPKKTIDPSAGIPDTNRSANDQLLVYIDNVANRFADSQLSTDQLKKVTDSFALYLPIMLVEQGRNVPDTVVSVTFHNESDARQRNRIYISLPRAIGTQLTFKALTNRFGPLDPEPPLFREHKAPPPVHIDLRKHSSGRKTGLYLLISAAHFPEAAKNQIVSIELVYSKE